MNNNEIKNPKQPVSPGTLLNEKDYMNSLLSCLKELEKNYTTALTEASNENIYQKYKEMFDTYSSLQREAYELMFNKGWYIIETAEAQKIEKKYKNLNQDFSDLNG